MSQNDFKTHQVDIAQSVRVITQRAEAMYALYNEALRNYDALARTLRAKEAIIRDYDAEWERRGKDPVLPYGMRTVQFTDRIEYLEKELKKFKDYGRLKDLAKMKVERARDEFERDLRRMEGFEHDVRVVKAENERLKELNTIQAEAYQALEKRVIINQSTANQLKEDLVTAGKIRALEWEVEKARVRVDDEKRARADAEKALSTLSDELATIRDAVKHPALYSRTSAW